jgi:queuosine precursor transporter
MNLFIFITHAAAVVAITLGALRLGREALVSWVALQAVLANLLVLKQMELFGFTVTCSDVYVVGSMLGLNLLQEYWGKPIVRRTIWVTLAAMAIFALMSQFQLSYRPASVDTMQGHYSALLSVAPRILLASLVGYFAVQQLDMWLFGWLKRTPLPLMVRSGISATVCQAVDTVLFAILGLWGLMAHLGDVIVASLVIKFVSIALMAPFTTLSRRLHVSV